MDFLLSDDEDQTCSTCRTLCMYPVTLPCGHSYCTLCLERALEIQDKCQFYYCPSCFELCQVRPLARRIIIPHSSSVQINCTYCGNPAMKTCVQCESSFCAEHLQNHPPGHIVIEPTLSLEDRKCSKHREILKYYCRVEGSCICASCYVLGEHMGHHEILLQDYAEQKKNNLRPLKEKFEKDIQEAEKQASTLHDYEIGEKKKAEAIAKDVRAQIEDLQRYISTRQDEVLSYIDKQMKLVSFSVYNQTKKLNTHKKELSKKKKRVMELCSMEDPLSFLRNEKESNIAGYYIGKCKINSKIDKMAISQKLHKRLLQFSDDLIDRALKDNFPKMKKSKIKLDKETAHYCMTVTYDLRTAIHGLKRQRGGSTERFKSHHVISMRSFSSGNHYWEVDVGMQSCAIGVACHSMNRKSIAAKSRIGLNDRSWSLRIDNVLSFNHNSVNREIPMYSPERSFGIFLEYKAGRLSFYQLCKPIRHLHTFTAIFTEPLHAAFYLAKGSSITIRK